MSGSSAFIAIPPEVQASIRAEAESLGYQDDALIGKIEEGFRQYREDVRAERAAEREERAAERAAERTHQLEMERLRVSQSPAPATHPHRNLMQPFKEDVPLDVYLRSFDSYCEAFDVSESRKVQELYALLPQRLLDVMGRLELEQRKKYDDCKTALLRAENYSPEDCRERYVTAFPLPEESMANFLKRKARLFADWLNLARVTDDCLRDFLIWDSVVPYLPLDMASHIRVQLKDSIHLDEYATTADEFLRHSRPGQRLSDVMKRHSVSGSIDPKNSPKPLLPMVNHHQRRPRRHHHQEPRKPANGQNHRHPPQQSPQPPSQQQPPRQLPSYRKEVPTNQRNFAPQVKPWQGNPQNHSRPPPFYPPKPSTHSSPRFQNGANRHESSPRNGAQPQARQLSGIQVGQEEEEVDCRPFEAPASLNSLTASGRNVPYCHGRLNDQDVQIILDTGAEGIFVDRSLVNDADLTGKTVEIRFAEGPPVRRPCCHVQLQCPYYNGKAPAIALENPATPVYLGRVKSLEPFFKSAAYDQAIARWNQRVPATLDAPQDRLNVCDSTVPPGDTADVQLCGPVTTRSTERDLSPAPLPEDPPRNPLHNKEEFRIQQENCPTLKLWLDHARKKESFTARGGQVVQFVFQEGLLYRQSTKQGQQETTLCIPKTLRQQVMYIGHHNPLSGHRGPTKTYTRIQRHFVWPKMRSKIERYVASCHECQVTSLRATPKAPMGVTKLSAEPFAQVCVDIIGPLDPPATSGKRYILTYVDMATRYPDAIAISSLEADTVAQALFQICSRVGFPETLTSDNGTNFTSRLFERFLQLLECRHIRTSVYHAQANGICERYNGTLKRCLRKLVLDFPRHWERYLPAALFAFRDTPHDTTGYSPFELIYGHRVRGPLEFLAECWQSEQLEEEDRDVHRYIMEFASRLKSACQTAVKSIQTQQQKSKVLFDRHARRRVLRPGDKVLLLLPTHMKKLMLRWKGPYTVTKRFDADHYAVQVDEQERRYHINLLKLYKEDDEAHRDPALALPAATAALPIASVTPVLKHYGAPAVPIEGGEEDMPVAIEEERATWYDPEAPLHLATALAIEEAHAPVQDGKDPAIPTEGTETYVDCKLDPALSNEQTDDLYRLLASYNDVLTDLPGRTDALEHDIRLVDDKPFRHSYAMPHHLSKQLKEDLEKWLQLGIVEPSDSPYCSPMLAVRKKDGSHRFCLDCRQLNARTIFDGEPIADPALIFTKLAKAEYLTKMDLASGFWQVPLSERAKSYTSFSCRHGLYQFRVMPFGLVNAPGCFSRLMRIVLRGIENVSCYIDDILIHASDWKSHQETLKKVLQRLRQHGLHLKPSKCDLGYRSLQYLGHIVGHGQKAPVEDKVRAIQELEKPVNVTQLRSFLGSVGYYQQFIPSFNSIAAPLHELLKGRIKKSTPLAWTPAAETAFGKLREALAGQPVLQLVDPELPFVLQTDASDEGIGAVLLQPRASDPRELAPVLYASRRLKAAERNYATIEKEALAIYWAIKKFEVYLYGREFVLWTDHRPLLYLQSADRLNPRLKRWAMYLTLFPFTSKHIEGDSNHLADLLSRRAIPEAQSSGKTASSGKPGAQPTKHRR